jgi:hypothetical protein
VEVVAAEAGSSCSRMGIAIGGGEPLPTDMGVALRGRHIGMTEQLLHGAQVGAPIEQMRREGVPKRMRMGRCRRTSIEDSAHIARRETATPLVAEQLVTGDDLSTKTKPTA